MARATRTVIVSSIVLTKRKYEVLRKLEESYRQMILNLWSMGSSMELSRSPG